MPLQDLIKGEVVSCRQDATIHELAGLMRDRGVGAVLVVDDEKPIGICTDRDIVLRCVCDGISFSERVERIMTSTVHTVKLDNGIQDIIRLMRDKEIRRVCVTDENGRAVGLVSFGDIVGLLAKELSDISATTPIDVAA